MTFDEFVRNFYTEEQCRDYLFKLRWPDGFICPKCGGEICWSIGDTLFECRCGRQTSVIAGTIFQGTRRPLKAWFTAIWWVTTQKNGASAEGLKQVLGLKSYETAWAWLHKIRTAMVRSDRTKLSGTVEVDDFYLGGEEHDGSTGGRGTGNKILVTVAIELHESGKLGRARLGVVADASKASLQSFIKNNIELGSKIITDGWVSYASLPNEGYEHEVYIQNKAETEEEKLPHVHLIISLLKRWLLGTHQGAISEKHIQSYLDEYVFRFNRRKSAKRGLLFYRLLEGAVATKPTTTAELYGKKVDF